MTSALVVRSSALAATSLLAATLATPAQAQITSPAQAMLDSPFVVDLGAFVLNTDLTGRLNGTSANNPDVDFDQTFGRDNNATRIRADALWRITPTHHLRLMYFDRRFVASKVLDQAVKWGDYTFQSGSSISSKREIRITELAYEYAFMRDPGLELAGSLGVHYTKMFVGLSGAATVTDANGNVSQVTASSKTSDVSAPLPVMGLRAAWAVAPQWVVDAQGQFFKVSAGGLDGNISDLRMGATWMVNPKFGIGAGYNRFVTSLHIDRNTFNGRLRLGYGGVLIYVTGVI